MEACVFSTATNLNLQNEHVFNAMVTELLQRFQIKITTTNGSRKKN